MKMDRIIRSVTISGGFGISTALSIWGQLPAVKNDASSSWVTGDPAFGFRWQPVSTFSKKGWKLFLNEGIVFPFGNQDIVGANNLIDEGSSNSLLGKGTYSNRFVGEIWLRPENQRSFGIQFLWETPLSLNNKKIRPGSVFQLSVNAIDYRFTKPGIVPYLTLSYRRQFSDSIKGNPVQNTDGWFVHGIGALDIRINTKIHTTLSVSSPWIVGIEGSDIKQLNLGLAFRWQTN